MPSTVERKLTTILCADVEGYSRLMDRDALAGLIGRHRGRVINRHDGDPCQPTRAVVDELNEALPSSFRARETDPVTPARR